MSRQNTCNKCTAWNGNGRDWCDSAECRNGAPQVREIVGGIARPIWPTTSANDWCMQFALGPHDAEEVKW